MTNPEIQSKLEDILAQIKELDNVKVPFYVAEKILAIEDKLRLAIKFLKISKD